MSVRAASLAGLLPTLVVAHLCAAAPSQVPVNPASTPGDFPIASDIRVGGDDAQTVFVEYDTRCHLDDIELRLPREVGVMGKAILDIGTQHRDHPVDDLARAKRTVEP